MNEDRTHDPYGQIPVRLAQVRDQVWAAARAAGRDPAAITLIGVSKYFPAEAAEAAVRAGLADLGENRVQELIGKQDTLAALGLMPRWHLIGTLQKNKVRFVVGRAALIHSGDSLDLLAEISRRSQQNGLVTDVLLQVNTAREHSKHGFDPEAAADAARTAALLPGLRLRGLMTMAPLCADPVLTLPTFQQTRALFDTIGREVLGSPDFDCLSMGMSQDYVQAIACGATHVRIGTAIFGHRIQP